MALVGIETRLLAKGVHRPHLGRMIEITSKLSTALADRYKIERHLGEGGMATALAHAASGH